jgi:hypothetical protein
VAEATPLPAPRSRFAPATDDAPPPHSRPTQADDDDMETRPLAGRRAAAAAAPAARERPRAQAPAPRRGKKAGRGNLLQILFYGSMAFVLVVGTIAGFASTIITTPIGALTPAANVGTANAAGDAALQAGNYSEAIRQYNAALSSNGSDGHALIGLAKAYFYKSPSEPDIAREYLARVFTAVGTDTPEGQEALQLLSTIGLPETLTSPTPGSPVASTPGTGATPGASTPAGTAGATPGAGTAAPAVNTPGLVATPGTGTTAPAGTTGPATTAPPGTDTTAPTAPGAPGPSTVAPAGTPIP